MSNAIELKNVSLSYNDRVILNDISHTITTGSIIGIVGLSGVGKTSLIRVANGNIKNDGNVKLDGIVLLFDDANGIENASIATVYQDPDTQIVFPNVLDEITFGMENNCFSKSKMDENLNKVTKDLGIGHLLERNPNNLSGGEKQLVVLCAMLCIEPKILLLDECISQVDEEGRQRVQKVLLELKDEGTTIVLIEHNFANLDIADEVFELKDDGLESVKKEVLK